MTQFTSFVAVEERSSSPRAASRDGGRPVEMPEGVSYEGVFGVAGHAAPVAWGQVHRGVAAASGRGQAFGGMGMGMGVPISQGTLRASLLRLVLCGPTKLAPKLRNLSKTLAAMGGLAGKVQIGKLRISGGRIEVRVYLKDFLLATLAKLSELGFKELDRSKTTTVVTGTIAVARLEALAELEAVCRVEPSP